MKEVIKWSGGEVTTGDTFSIPNHYQVVRVLDIVGDGEHVYAVLKYHTNVPELWNARRFVHLVDKGYFTPVDQPKYRAGKKFVHQLNNTTVEILTAAPTKGTSPRTYFVLWVNETGAHDYITVDEAYLNNCVQLPDADPELIPVPDIAEGTEFPEVSYENTPL